MPGYDLPTSATIGNAEYPIRSDWRPIIDIIEVMSDPDISDEERAYVTLSIFYPDFKDMPEGDIDEAIAFMHWFISGGGDRSDSAPEKPRGPKLMDWGQDLPILISPINRVLGCEVRAIEYLHWWTFLSAYYEIGGDCLFAQVVSIRKKRAQGKKLDKTDAEFYLNNKEIIDFKVQLSSEEEKILEEWI